MTELDRIKSAVDITALVGKHYTLEGGQSSRYLKAKEHDSLVVDRKRQSYYWNSQGESGDLIDWVGRHELAYNGQWNSADPGLFKEAVTWLAKYAGLPEPQFKAEDTEARAARLSRERLMALAADHYQAGLADSPEAMAYAAGRGFTPETIQAARLGYADGKLWQAITPDDRETAAACGLIEKHKTTWRDAIPAGYLVYCHWHKGHPVYFAGRHLVEKQHRNIKAEKRMYWAAWPGFGPLVILEGQADAISLAQLGVSALALCGTNTSDFDPDLVKLYSPVYIWQDNDEPDSEAARAWQKRLNELVKALGPLVRVIEYTEAKDANAALQAGFTADDLAGLLQEARPWLDRRIEEIAGLKGADRYDSLEPLFCHLTHLDIFQLNVYRSKVCKDLEISQGDFGRYLKAAKGQISEDEESEFSKGGQYTTVDGWTVLKTFSEDGTKPKLVPLANGSARIIEEISMDDGSNEPQLDFLIAGELATGHKLPKIQIPAADFSKMAWVAKWGSRFILSAGRSTQDHFRAAVQHLSGSPTPPHRRTIYTHTGWRQIGDKWLFLTSSGALGSGDDSIQVDLKMGRPDTHMTRYNLPTPEDVTTAMTASLSFWHIADFSITVPIWAAMFLAPLTPFLSPDFGLWVHGQTGSMKSSIVAACLAHFGDWQGKDGKSVLPSNFQSTANAILLNAFQAKDVPLVIDDFAPGATQKEMRERDNTASNLLRSIGNKAARGRMRDGRHFQADFPPRCLALITAEDLPATASIMARGIGVRVHIPPKGDPARRPIEERLTQAQTVDSFLYPHAMAAFILWVQRHWEELTKELPAMAGTYRDQMQAGGHARLPDAFGKLMAAADTALYFAMDCGAITETQAKEKKRQALEAMGLMMTEHGEAVESVDSTRIFQETLIEHIDARDWYLARLDADTTTPPPNSPIGAVCVGYEDDNFIYLLGKTETDIRQSYQKLGTPFPVGRNTLYKRLIEKGWLIPGAGKTTTPTYIPALGITQRVLKLVKKAVFPDD